MARIGTGADSTRPVRAAGFVLHRPGRAGLEYLTLVNRSHGDVGFPKGHCEPGETDLETAVRETLEETGLRVEPNPWFRREIGYPVKAGFKTVAYFVARPVGGTLALSREHASGDWVGLDDAVAALRHEGLRAVLRDAAVFLKDPVLRRGLDPAGARALLVDAVGADAPVVRHTAHVAAMARALAGPLEDVDAGYVEAAAWLHDIGRARAHDERHTLEGFRLVCAAGHPGYAPPCLSHYAKGRSFEAVGDERLARSLFQACDLTTFEPEERCVALADFLVAGDRRVRIEERHADLVARYGASPFIDESLAIAARLKQEWEAATGLSLYGAVGLD